MANKKIAKIVSVTRAEQAQIEERISTAVAELAKMRLEAEDRNKRLKEDVQHKPTPSFIPATALMREHEAKKRADEALMKKDIQVKMAKLRALAVNDPDRAIRFAKAWNLLGWYRNHVQV